MKLIGIARLGNDAEIRYTPSGKAVTNLSLAYNYGQKGEGGNRETQWVEATLWGDQAERLKEWLVKGTVLNVICRDVHIETYEGRKGTGHKLVGTVADIEFVPRQKADTDSPPAQRPAASTTKSGSGFDDMDDDIPF